MRTRNRKSNRSSATRRSFLRSLAATGATLLPFHSAREVLGQTTQTAPSDRLGIGIIGLGGMGMHHLQWLLERNDVQIVALCDVDRRHLAAAEERIAQHKGQRGIKAFQDFRQLLQLEEVDAVFIVTPDHWHGLIGLWAAQAGKDIYCEKPLTHSIREGRLLCQAVTKYGRILQCGSHERSNDRVRYACELARNGYLGEIRQIRVALPCDEWHHQEVRTRQQALVPQPIPPELDFDFWMGPTPVVPYHEKRCHFWWRFHSHYGGGEITDRGAHIMDLAQLALGMDESGPIRFRGKGRPLQGEFYDAVLDFDFENEYSSGVRLVGSTKGPRGLRIHGTEGAITIHIHGGALEAEPSSLLQIKLRQSDLTLGRTPDHRINFFDCVKSRQAPFAAVETAHRTATLCHLNNLAIRLGRELHWDPAQERILDDDEANSLLIPKLRPPWTFP